MLTVLLAIVVSASIDSTSLMIGDQTDMHIRVTQETNEQVEWPVFGETLQDGIEIVDRTIVDTTTLPDGRLQLTQYLTLTSFKDSLFAVQPIAVVSGNDTFWTDPMALNVVQPFDLSADSTNAITDIKGIERAPIWWWGIFRWVLLALGIALVLAGLGYLLYWLLGKRKPQEEPINPELLRPADEVALEKLDAIKIAKIWQKGQVKEYHTDLTDVVREYISRRFDVQSTEKTSDETLRELKPLLMAKDEGLTANVDGKALYDKLSKMLQLADLVKFAKWTTTPDENESALITAYEFVNQTKIIDDLTNDE
ncbi:MAG: hypothetical protein IKQ50_05605 [Paludibacteraceae bacterium]|nr:hypothetical protein [Paludibacteraceae bacterium]